MATYQNTIEITDLSYNEVSGNMFFYVDNITLSSNITLNKNLFLNFKNGGTIVGSGRVGYNTSQTTYNNSIFLYDTSGDTTPTGFDTYGLFDISDNQVGAVTFGNTRQSTGNNYQYKGLSYTLWNDLSQNVGNGFVNNIVFYPDDDAGGPDSVSQPSFVAIGSPVKIRSTLSDASGGRVRVVGWGNQDATSHQEETISSLSGETVDNYVVDFNPGAGNPGLWIGIDPLPDTADEDYLYTFFAESNCFHSQTILETENGPICIKDIKRGMLVKTRNGFKKVVRVLSNGCKLKDFVVFEKGSLGPNVPNKKLMITKGHPVYYRGKYLNSLEFVKNNFFDKIYIKRLETEGLHHIQFETHECILTNNLWTTSLPHNMGNKVPEDLYFDKSLFNPNDKGNHYPPYCLHKDPPTDQLDDDDLEEIFNYN